MAQNQGSSAQNISVDHEGPVVISTIKVNYMDEPIEVSHCPTLTFEEGTPDGDQKGIHVAEEENEDDDEDEGDTKTPKGQKSKNKRYYQKFRESWKEMPQFRSWLGRGETPEKAYCTICNKELIAGKSELMRHLKGKKHIQKCAERVPVIENIEELTSVINDETGLPETLRFIDLRSDTVTRPCRAMKESMFSSQEGDGFVDDPAIGQLERKVANLLNKEAAMYVPSGTMANLICVLAHCWGRGSEVIVGDESHMNKKSEGGIAQIGSIYHRTIPNLPDGTFSLTELLALTRRENLYGLNTTLVCIENTHNMKGGKALPLDWLDELGEACRELNVPIHMDGARLMNAAVALGTNPGRLVASCDSVAFCLNKGLGAPMGSLVVGSNDFIARAMSLRKVLGGGLRQTGMMASAAIYSLDHLGTKLSQDHAHARAIANSVAEEHSSAVHVELKSVQTNIVLLHCDKVRVDAHGLCQRLQSIPDLEFEELGERIIIMALPLSDSVVRLMTHRDVKKDDVRAAKKKFQYVVQEYDNMFSVPQIYPVTEGAYDQVLGAEGLMVNIKTEFPVGRRRKNISVDGTLTPFEGGRQLEEDDREVALKRPKREKKPVVKRIRYSKVRS